MTIWSVVVFPVDRGYRDGGEYRCKGRHGEMFSTEYWEGGHRAFRASSHWRRGSSQLGGGNGFLAAEMAPWPLA